MRESRIGDICVIDIKTAELGDRRERLNTGIGDMGAEEIYVLEASEPCEVLNSFIVEPPVAEIKGVERGKPRRWRRGHHHLYRRQRDRVR